jgi:anti-sigma B factor antagonist
MEFVITEYNHCDLIQILGRIDSYTAPKLEEALAVLMADGHFKFVIDLQGVSYLSSSGMLTLINTQKKCQQHNGGEIFLANVSERILSSLELAGFDRLFKFFDDIVTAVGKF